MKKEQEKSKKHAARDRTKYLLDQIDQTMDIRDTWLGVKNMNSNRVPKMFERLAKNGKLVQRAERVEATAGYLKENRWGNRIGLEEYELLLCL